MQRRQLLAITGGTLTAAIAGCVGTDGDSESTPKSSPQVEVEFTVEDSDLVVTHVEGDVLQSGQTVYVTVAGETATETTLGSDIHAGGEIIRVEDAKDNYEETHIVALYLERQDTSREIGTGEITFSTLGQPAPNTQVAFNYDAEQQTLVIHHDGGDSLKPENTGSLTVAGDASQATWHVGTEGGNTAEATTLNSSSSRITTGQEMATVSSISSGGVVEFQWVSNGGGQSSTLGTFEAP